MRILESSLSATLASDETQASKRPCLKKKRWLGLDDGLVVSSGQGSDALICRILCPVSKTCSAGPEQEKLVWPFRTCFSIGRLLSNFPWHTSQRGDGDRPGPWTFEVA